jgi:transposase-like protein
MPQPYSADLRERVLVAYEHGEGSQVAIARRFRVCPATVCNWIHQAQKEAGVAPSRTAADLPVGWVLLSWRCCKTSWLRPTMLA